MNVKEMRSTGLLRVVVLRLAMVLTCAKNDFLKKPPIRLTALVAGLTLGFCLGAGPAMSAGGMDPDADKILKSMSTYLDGLPAFTVSGDVDSEVIDLSGQKLQFSSSVAIAAKRPGNLYVSRQGAIADVEIIFNGKTLTLNGKGLNVYKQIGSPGTIDDAFDTMQVEIGLDMPGADLLYADPYIGLSSGVVSSTYLGTDFVNGVECHNLAFRQEKTDWQLWVQVGDAPVPMKYIITTKWMTGAPQYSVRFRDWNTKPQIEANRFEFSAPEGARKLETIDVNEMGELMIKGVQ
jgi:hypothetical protein